ncbi:MAG: hypothetical protein FWG83_08340 [Oscillospiraceae bacterium]|nr:hypothetical protein [Oscillospiraceae bacterium]
MNKNNNESLSGAVFEIANIRVIMLIFIILPLLIAGISGFVMLKREMSDFNAGMCTAQAYSKSGIISAITGEHTAFLNAAAVNSAVKGAAANDWEASEETYSLMETYIENANGVYDMLVTDENGLILLNYSGIYSPATSFRDDVGTMKSIATSPTPVSAFYEDGKFYWIRPIKSDEENNAVIGYIVIKAESEFVFELIRNVSDEEAECGVIAVFDENSAIISSNGEISKALRDRVAEYPTTKLLSPNNEHGAYEEFRNGNHYGAVGNIPGTKWRWIVVCTISQSEALGIFGKVFAIAAGVSLFNAVVMFVISKRLLNARKR